LKQGTSTPQERKRNAPAQGGRHVVCRNGFTDEEAWRQSP
jgi:hypothetical protein